MAASAIDVRFAGLPLLVAQSTSAFNAGDQLKVGSREKTVAQLGSADAANKCIGVAANTGLSGDQCSFVPIGPLVTGTSDGTAAINAGDAVTNSSTTAGAVKSGTGSFLGRAWTAVANGQTTGVTYFAGGAADAVLGGSTTLATTYADGAAATDQTMSVGAGNGGAIQVKGSGAGTGQLFVVKDSSSNSLLNIQDNAIQLIQSGVADGPTAVGTAVDTVTSLANAGAKIFSVRNAGAERIFVDATGNLRVSVATAGILNAGGTTGILFGDGTLAASIFGGDLAPRTDLANSNGGSARRWTNSWSRQYNGIEQTIAGAATFTIDPAAGESTRVTLNATAINAAGIAAGAGNPGEIMRTEFIQDATGGRTLTQANFSTAWVFAGAAYTVTATANKRDILTWMWDTVASKWYEIGRVVNL